MEENRRKYDADMEAERARNAAEREAERARNAAEREAERARNDRMWKDCIDTANESASSEIIENLLRFFCETSEKECFCAALYTCFRASCACRDQGGQAC